MRAALGVAVGVFSLFLLGCPAGTTPDGGTGGGTGGGSGGGGGADAGFVNYLPEVFESAYGRAVAVYGGKLYVAGNAIRADAGTNNDFFLARYSLDLVRDPTFGTDGVALGVFDGGVAVVLPQNNDFALSIAFLGDRPVLVGAARAFVVGGDLGLARFDSTGALDSTFGTGGLRVDSFGADFPAALTSAAVLGDGSLITSGTVSNGPRGQDLLMLRYRADGTVDPAFSLTDAGAGAVVDFGNNRSEEGRGLIIQATAVVSGGGQQFPAARFTLGGALDTSFGGSGTGRVTNGPGNARKLVQRADGSLWLVGDIELNRDGGPGTEATFLKQVALTADGTPLPGFGTNGARIDAVAGFGLVRGAAVQGDGKLLVYFSYLAGTWLLRLNTDGSLDTGFGTNGLLKLPLTLPLLDGASASGNHLVIDGNTAFVTDINVVNETPSRLRQVLGLVKVAL